MRLLEEAMELAQSEGITQLEADQIAAMVFSKPSGDPYKELGGVMITLAAYAGLKDFSMHFAAADEYRRIQDPELMERVRRRNLPGGDKIGQLA